MGCSQIFWGCILALPAIGLEQSFLVSGMRREIGGDERLTSSPLEKRLPGLVLLWHESKFPASSKRRFYCVMQILQVVVGLAAVGAIVVAQFQPGNTLHLIP